VDLSVRPNPKLGPSVQTGGTPAKPQLRMGDATPQAGTSSRFVTRNL
jgi:hypothetical protein